MRRQHICLISGLVLSFLVLCSTAFTSVREDLTACKLTNGLTTLPSRGSPGAAKAGGYIFAFSTQKFAVNPFEAEDKTPASLADLFTVMRERHTGDLMYSTANKGTLLAVSGRMADLGRHYLYELSGKELERPSEVWSIKEKSGRGERTPGAIEEVAEGHCYLVETTDSKYALVRIVAFLERAVQVQWVYQTDGTKAFDIPTSEPIPVSVPERGNTSARGGQPSDVAVKPFEAPIGELRLSDPDAVRNVVSTHLKNRAEIVKGLMVMLQDTQDSSFRGLAAKLLGDLRAEEAIPLLASMIDRPGPAYGTLISGLTYGNMYPCAGALSKMGIPGAEAAISELAKIEVPITDAGRTRIRLCASVVHEVYGPKLAAIVLKDKLANAKSDGERAVLDAAIKELGGT